MPISISNIPMLKEFYVNENSIISIQDSYFNSLKYLEIMHIYKNELSQLNPFMFGISERLKELNADSNNIGNFPEDSFQNLRNLETLSVQDNIITEFHAGIIVGSHEFSNIQHLYLKQNRLRSSSNISFDNMPNLAILDLFNNVKEVLIFNNTMTTLTDLHLQKNEITMYPMISVKIFLF